MRRTLPAVVALALACAAAPADAAVILTFGQIGAAPTITATANPGGTATTISASDALIGVTQIAGGVPGNAFFNLDVTSTDTATPLGGGGFQHYAGTFSIFSGAGQTGVNYLSGSFVDVVLGVGPSGVLAAGSPPDIINFTSDIIAALSAPSAISLSFAGLSPSFALFNETIASFTSSVSGTFSATEAIPEPATLGLLGLGLLGIAVTGRRREPAA